MEDIVDANPWIATSIFDFTYFCCPECDDKSKSKEDFVIHAFTYHKSVSFHELKFLSFLANLQSSTVF